jgi:hypothetical protein
VDLLLSQVFSFGPHTIQVSSLNLIQSKVSSCGPQTITGVQLWTSYYHRCPVMDLIPSQVSSGGIHIISPVQWWTLNDSDASSRLPTISSVQRWTVDFTPFLLYSGGPKRFRCPVVDSTQSQVSSGGLHTLSPVQWWTLNDHDVHW